MILTIAMVVYNEEKRLSLIRGNLQVFKNHRRDVEVLILDNASTDQTAERLAAWQEEFCFRLLRRTQNNMGAARAEAASSSRTPWLAFLDADCEVNDGWLALALAKIDQMPPNVAALGGPWVPAGPSGELFRSLFKTFYGHFNMPQIKNDDRARPVRHIPTACVIYRRRDLIDSGNFDPERSRVGEDLDMSYRLLSRRKDLLLIPELRFDHHLPESLAEWFRKIFVYGQARLRMAVRYGDLLAPNYLLPLFFFLFMFVNLIFLKPWRGLPLVIYAGAALLVSLLSNPSGKTFKITLYMIATHVAYAAGMGWEAVNLGAERIWKRKPLVPTPRTPTSREGISETLSVAAAREP